MKILKIAVLGVISLAAQPLHKSELLFPSETWHNHSSSITELPNGDLFVSWFHGSGERQSDDVKIQGARWRKSTRTWSDRFELADTPGFPDTNCVVWLDSRKRLWLFWPAILANTWESALMKYRVSSDYLQADGPPEWDWQDNILLIPKRMQERTQEVFARELTRPGPLSQWASRMIALAGDKQFSRLGWFTRTHPLELPSGRILLPLYSDGFSFGLMAISDDGGKSWHASEPIVGFGNIQPSVVRKKSGELVAYMRDNGPAPKRAHRSISRDNGETWSAAEDTSILNPGSSLEAIGLKDGRWIMAYNDTEKGRASLAISMSDDEGESWKWIRHMEKGSNFSYSYPSLMQAADGTLHITYSSHETKDGKPAKSIKYVHFNTAWIEQGDYKQAVKDRYPAFVVFSPYGEMIPNAKSYIDLDGARKDEYGLPAARRHVQWGPNDKRIFADMQKWSSEILRAAGAEILKIYEEPRTNHELGGARMGDDPKASIVDRNCRTHDVANLFIVDGSVFPSASEKNPTHTIMALAARAAVHIASRFQQGEL